MICRYHNLRHYPGVFHVVTGLQLTDFEQLRIDMLPIIRKAAHARLQRHDRRRATGAGRPTGLTHTDQLLMSVIWLRQHPTNDLLGFLFDTSDSTASRVLNRILPLLEAAGKDTMRLPDPGRKRHKTLDMLLEEIPELAVMSKVFEQSDLYQQEHQMVDDHHSSEERGQKLKSRVVAKEDEVGGTRNVKQSTTTSPFLVSPTHH